MTNQEFIEKYGEEEGRRRIDKRNELNRIWRKEHAEYFREYNKNNRERINANARAYQATRRDKQQEWMNAYHETKEGRAVNLLTSYRQFDMRKFGEFPFLTKEDIMRICFSEDSKCVWCGNTTWTELGLDRVSNLKPHSLGNVICCCRDCNSKRNKRTIGENLERIKMSVDQWMVQNGMTDAEPLTVKYPLSNQIS